MVFTSEDLSAYWTMRGRSYFKEFLNRGFWHGRYADHCLTTLISQLRKLKFDSVLDVGCGFGRVTRRIHQAFPEAKIHGLDLSPDQITKAWKYLDIAKGGLISFECNSFQDFTPMKYDLVLSTAFLMHIPPKEIAYTVQKMAECSNKYVVNMDWISQNSRPKAEPHCFAHDYYNQYIFTFLVSHVNRVPLPKRPFYSVGFGWDTGLKLKREPSELHCIFIAHKKSEVIS